MAIFSLLPLLLLATPASAVTSAEKAQTCKIGADAQKLTGAKRKTFIAHCMANGDAKPMAAKKGGEPPSKLTRKQKMETCIIGADDQKLTDTARKTFIDKCMANEPRRKTASKKPMAQKPTQLVPPPKPQ
jgi:hypothetical protein